MYFFTHLDFYYTFCFTIVFIYFNIIKDNLFDIPPLFKLIQEESNTDPKEMYKVFNMGHRMEIYTDSNTANKIIEISNSYDIEAKIIGKVQSSKSKKLTINSELGNFDY